MIANKLLEMNDMNTELALKNQVTDSSTGRHFGGIVLGPLGIPRPSHMGTGQFIASMASSLIDPNSKYFHDLNLAERLSYAMKYMLANQHEDGTISPGGTNFNSPPDTGFVVTGMCQVYEVLKKSPWEPLHPIVEDAKLFLERTIPAMVTGGCHTPNHRWVMTAALASLYPIFQDDILVSRADEWLAEGMDYTVDGEWSERSNAIYNTVSDIMLYYTAHYLKRPELLDGVRKNLNMMVYMIHPNGDVVTEYSERQDFGKRDDLSEYYLSYRLMAAYDKNPLFAAMADLVEQQLSRLGPINNHAMLGRHAFPETDIGDMARAVLPDHYEKVFNEHYPVQENQRLMEQTGHHGKVLHTRIHSSFGAPLVRIREGKTSATVMSRSPYFFSLRHGEASLLGVQIFTSFTPGRVEMEQFSKIENGYRMTAAMDKGYNGPIAPELIPEYARKHDNAWCLLPHQLRPLTHVQYHNLSTEILRTQEGWDIRIFSDERQDVVTQVAFTFHPDCVITGEELLPLENGNQFWRGGTVRCMKNEDWIEISSGAHDHGMTGTRGLTNDHRSPMLLVNLLTPFDKVFRIQQS